MTTTKRPARPTPAGSPPATDKDLLLKYMEMAHSHYKLDVEQIWKRGSVFLTISSAMIAFRASGQYQDAHIADWAFHFAAIIMSLVWLVSSMVSLHWVRYWREQVRKLDLELKIGRSFSHQRFDSGGFRWLARPQTYAVVLASLFLALWLGVAVASLSQNDRMSLPSPHKQTVS